MGWIKHLRWINFRKLWNWIISQAYPIEELKGSCFWGFKHRVAFKKGYGHRCIVCGTPNQKCKGER